MKRAWMKMGIIMGGFILGLAAIKGWKISKAIAEHSSFMPPPEAITSLVLTETSWEPSIEVVGALSAEKGTMVSAEEPGRVVQIGFESGSAVKQGDLLVKLDTSVEEGQLKSALARVDFMAISLKRAQTLRGKDVNSQADLDSAQASYRQAQGDAEAIRGQISRKTITASFDGVAGIRLVDLGQYLTANTPIVSLQDLDPLHVNFAVPQGEVLKLSPGQKVRLSVSELEGENIEGSINAIDPQIEEKTRNVRVQATVSNPEGKLRPGMFAHVSIVLPEKSKVLTVPISAISYAPYGNSVYVLDKKKDDKGAEYQEARQQFVKLGATRGDQVVVTSGLKPGEEVATSGIFKLRPGAHVFVDNSVVPGNDRKPKPLDS